MMLLGALALIGIAQHVQLLIQETPPRSVILASHTMSSQGVIFALGATVVHYGHALDADSS